MRLHNVCHNLNFNQFGSKINVPKRLKSKGGKILSSMTFVGHNSFYDKFVSVLSLRLNKVLIKLDLKQNHIECRL